MSKQLAIDFEAARAARDAGMQQALDHATDVNPEWPERAYAFLVEFAKAHSEFISEDVSDASRAASMPQPPTDRAWGAIYRKAIKLGVIIQNGSGRSRRRHNSICPKWASQIYRSKAA